MESQLKPSVDSNLTFTHPFWVSLECIIDSEIKHTIFSTVVHKTAIKITYTNKNPLYMRYNQTTGFFLFFFLFKKIKQNKHNLIKKIRSKL